MNRDAYLKRIELRGDGEVVCRVAVAAPVRRSHPEELAALVRAHPGVEVSLGADSGRPAGARVTDAWGCVWEYPIPDLDGQVVVHPLASWDALPSFVPPDPAVRADWAAVERDFADRKRRGLAASCGTEHGFLFLRLSYLRGYENFMADIGAKDPRLFELRDTVAVYWAEVVRRYVDAGADIVSFGDDLGLQHSLPISPADWRALVGPAYREIFSLCRRRGVHVHLHSDGWVVDIIPDLLAAGVSVLNVQDLVNGIDRLRDLVKGRAALELDIDRQSLTVFGRPEEIDAHIGRCVRELGSPSGGLSMIWGVYPGTPLSSIEAVVAAMDRHRLFWTPRP